MTKLTVQTSPDTIMFEGFPQVQIEAVDPVPFNSREFYIRIKDPAGVVWNDKTLRKGNNHAYGEDGFDKTNNPDNVWPRLVPRVKFDPAKPIVGHHREDGEVIPMTLIETIIPADGTETRYKVRRSDKPAGDGAEFDILASTGRSTTTMGSALDFVNGITRGVVADDGRISLNVTEVNGEITAVEWVK